MATKKPTHAELMAQLGYDTAKQMHEDFVRFEQSCRQQLTALAEKHHEEGDILAILAGVSKYYKEIGYTDAAARVKKAEFKAVLDACSKPGSRAHNLEVLRKFEGGYNAFITKARELRDANKPESAGSTGGGGSPRKLSDKGAKKVHDAIGRAVPDQLVSVVDDSVKNMVVFMRSAAKPGEATLIGRKLIATIQHTAAALLKTEAAEQVFKDAAEQISVICESVLNKTDQAMKDAQEALKKSQETKPEDAEEEEELHDGTNG